MDFCNLEWNHRVVGLKETLKIPQFQALLGVDAIQ